MAMWRGAPEKELSKARQRKYKSKKDDGGAGDRRADGKTEVKGGKLHTMFTSLVYAKSDIDFSSLREDS